MKYQVNLNLINEWLDVVLNGSMMILLTYAVESGEDMIQCCNPYCEHSWFHLTCVDLQEAPRDDWYCSQACKNHKGYIYCSCKTKKNEQKIQCHLADACRKHEWYHPSCVGLQNRPIPGKMNEQ